MNKYKQLTYKERYQIYALLKEGLNFTQIARNIGCHKSTISREIKRNSLNNTRYSPDNASIETFTRHRDKPKFIKITKVVKKYIHKYLKKDWTPEQVAGKLRRDSIVNISHESIYQYIYKNKKNGGRLYLLLVHKAKKYNKRSSIYNSRGTINNRISIHKRPKIVDNKTRIGDWEVDLIIGKYHKGSIVTIVDRKSKFTLMKKLPTKESIGVTNTIIELMYPIKNISHTITSDNGKEFSLHENISNSLNIDFYFCDPYSSWQRGLNENTNGLIRRYIPKKTEFENISDNEIMMIQNKLNHRPRKSLDYKTPFEVFFKEISSKMSA